MKSLRNKVFALVGVFSLFAVAACGTSSDGEAGEAGPSQLTKVIESGTLRVAILPDYPPFSQQLPSGEFEGYEVDVAQELADALGVELEIVSTDGATRLAKLQANQADVNISAWTSTNERAKTAGYSIPYVAAGAGVLHRQDTQMSDYDELNSMRVSVARGSTNDTIVTEMFPDADITRFESIEDAIQALKSNQVDAVVEGRTTIVTQAEKDPSLVALDQPPLRPSLISMGVLPGDQVFINYLDNFIRNLNASGVNDDLYQKWFNDELPEVVK